MKVVAFANNRVGRKIVEYLAQRRGGDLVGLVMHSEGEREYGAEILEASELPEERVLEAPAFREERGRARLGDFGADVGVSAFFGYILPPEVLELFPAGCINLHPAYLPFNRGTYPNVWSIVEGTPAGASLHYMDEGIDTGAVLARRRIAKRPWDTGETLYRRLEDACITLFRDAWPEFAAGNLEGEAQDPRAGSHHYESDVQQIDPIDLDVHYEARALIDRLRARTFPPHRGCYFEVDGRRVYMRLQLWPEEEYPPEENTNEEHGG